MQEIECHKKYFSSNNEIFHPRTQILDEVKSKGKSIGEKRGLRYLNDSTTPSSEKTNFLKVKKVIPIVQTPTRAIYTCSFCYRNGHTSDKCYIRKFEEIHMKINMLVVESKALR